MLILHVSFSILLVSYPCRSLAHGIPMEKNTMQRSFICSMWVCWCSAQKGLGAHEFQVSFAIPQAVSPHFFRWCQGRRVEAGPTDRLLSAHFGAALAALHEAGIS